MENSDPESSYDVSKMIEWIYCRIPPLYSMQRIKQFREEKKKIQKYKQSSRYRHLLNQYDSDQDLDH